MPGATLSFLSVVVGVVGWHVFSLFFPSTLLPGPAEVVDSLRLVWSGGVFLDAVRATFYHVVVGTGLVIGLGSALGFVMGLWGWAEDTLKPWIPLFQVIPGVVAMAFALVAFGVGSTGVIFSMLVVGIAYMTLNVWQGFKSIDQDLLEMAEAFYATRAQVVRYVMLPAIVPHIVSGSRIVLGIAWHVVVFAEFIVGESGIGKRIDIALYLYNTAEVFGWGGVIIGMMMALDFGILRPLDGHFSRYREAEAG
ncbi:MAG: ABC transporter permease [Anaerolineae bacterium]